MKKIFQYFVPAILAILATSCNKSEGEGGKGSIVGIVHKIIDDGAIIALADGTYAFDKDTITAVDEDVYIIYGTEDYGYDDKTKTSYNGTFKFEYLRDGNYKVFAYTDLASGEKEAIFQDVKVDDDSQVKVSDFYIYDGKNIGRCGVVGRVSAFWKDAMDYQPAVAQRVYIQKVGSSHVDDTRADANGMYGFAKLDPNSQYVVYAETEPGKNEGIKAQMDTLMTGAAGTIVQAKELKVIIY